MKYYKLFTLFIIFSLCFSFCSCKMEKEIYSNEPIPDEIISSSADTENSSSYIEPNTSLTDEQVKILAEKTPFCMARCTDDEEMLKIGCEGINIILVIEDITTEGFKHAANDENSTVDSSISDVDEKMYFRVETPYEEVIGEDRLYTVKSIETLRSFIKDILTKEFFDGYKADGNNNLERFCFYDGLNDNGEKNNPRFIERNGQLYAGYISMGSMFYGMPEPLYDNIVVLNRSETSIIFAFASSNQKDDGILRWFGYEMKYEESKWKLNSMFPLCDQTITDLN